MFCVFFKAHRDGGRGYLSPITVHKRKFAEVSLAGVMVGAIYYRGAMK